MVGDGADICRDGCFHHEKGGDFECSVVVVLAVSMGKMAVVDECSCCGVGGGIRCCCWKPRPFW